MSPKSQDRVYTTLKMQNFCSWSDKICGGRVSTWSPLSPVVENELCWVARIPFAGQTRFLLLLSPRPTFPCQAQLSGQTKKKHQPLSLLAIVVVVTILNTQFHQIQMCNIILIYFCSLCWELGDPLLFRNVLPSCLSCNNANMNMTFQMSFQCNVLARTDVTFLAPILTWTFHTKEHQISKVNTLSPKRTIYL